MSQFIWAKCESCGNEMNVPYGYRGTEQRCRKCAAGFIVPDPEEVEAQAPGVEEIDREARVAFRSKAKLAALLTAAGLLMVVIGFTALLLWERSNVAPPTVVDLVRETLRAEVLVTQTAAGPLREGTAVLINDQAAYWVYQGEVLAANSAASGWSPGIRRAPAGIDGFLIAGATKPVE